MISIFNVRSDDRAKNKPNDNLYQYGYIDMDTDYNNEFSQKNPEREVLLHIFHPVSRRSDI